MSRHGVARLQASEQYLTSCQLRAQALRQTMTRPQRRQCLLGKNDLLPLKSARVGGEGMPQMTMILITGSTPIAPLQTQKVPSRTRWNHNQRN